MLRKLRLKQKNSFLIKKPCKSTLPHTDKFTATEAAAQMIFKLSCSRNSGKFTVKRLH